MVLSGLVNTCFNKFCIFGLRQQEEIKNIEFIRFGELLNIKAYKVIYQYAFFLNFYEHIEKLNDGLNVYICAKFNSKFNAE